MANVTPLLFRGYAVENFRPFSGKVSLENLGTVNVLAGPNNVGKSALLAPLRLLTRTDQRFIPLKEAFSPEHPTGLNFPHFDARDWRLLDVPIAAHFDVELDPQKNGAPGTLRSEESRCTLVAYAHESLHRISISVGVVPERAQSSVGVTEQTNRARELFARVVYVPPTRRVVATLTPTPDAELGERLYSGERLYADVLDWALDSGKAAHKERLEVFASKVLDTPVRVSASVKPPAVLVALGDEPPRPLELLGQGVEQVLIIAAATALVERPILLLEEPELGLHPLAQRRLISALAELDDACSFVTTHSNHVLDCVEDGVQHYHLRRLPDGKREVRNVARADLKLLADLGVRPSSLLQANAVVWVEGPSDAVYLRAWLRAFGGSGLVEGVDYAFAYYGGALLDHMRALPEAQKVVLPWLHPSWFLVADSDRASTEDEPTKPYLRRLLDSLTPGRSWVTQGREIESYLGDEALVRALDKERASLPTTMPAVADYEPLKARLERLGLPVSYAASKVALAQKVVEATTEWPDRLDRRARIGELVAFISTCRASVPAEEPARAKAMG